MEHDELVERAIERLKAEPQTPVVAKKHDATIKRAQTIQRARAAKENKEKR